MLYSYLPSSSMMVGGIERVHGALQAYPGVYDTLRFFFVGLFVDLTRRMMFFAFSIFSQGFTVTARISDNDEVFDWISHYISLSLQSEPPATHRNSNFKNSLTRPNGDKQKQKQKQKQDYTLRSFILEGIWPTGRAAPRDIQLISKRMHPLDQHDLIDPLIGHVLPPRGAGRGSRGNDGRWGNAHEVEDEVEDEEVDESEIENGVNDEVGGGTGLAGNVEIEVTPSHGIPQYIKYKGHTIKIVFDKQHDSPGQREETWIVMSTWFATHQLFLSLVRTAQRNFSAKTVRRTMIFTPDLLSRVWHRSSTKTIRPWSSVIMPPGVKEWIYNDAKEFLAEREFYTKRGLPHRRGYLFYGVPGSGKSSLISALAAKLKLDIYVVNLGSPMLNDDSLAALLANCPARCLLLMEDIDCAFGSRGERKKSPATHEPVNDGELDERSVVSEGNEDDPISPESGISSFQSSQQPPTPISATPVAQRLTTFLRERATSGATPRTRPARGLGVGNQISPSWESTNKAREVTLSGLLNALDGVASSEGRLLFCTTNWRESIDPALSRPGRCDVWIEFKHATASQARDVFLHFYDEAHERTRKDSHGTRNAARTKVDPDSPPETSGNEKNDRHRQGGKASSPLDSDPDGEKETASGNSDAQIEAVSNEKAHLKHELSKSNGDHGRSVVVVVGKQHRGTTSNITQFDLVPELAENPHSSSNRSFTPTEIVSLAEEFASSIPEDTISVSALTGYLVKYKRRPDLAAACVGEWAKGGCAQDPTAGGADGLGA